MKADVLKTGLAVSAGILMLGGLMGPAGAMMHGDAIAELQSPDGESRGTVEFMQGPNGVHVMAELEGLPEGTHAFHIHTTGACSPDFTAAGGHFNPTNKKHGFMSKGGPHLGDTPNIHVPASGDLVTEVFLSKVTVDGSRNVLMDDDGAAVVIHAGPDDYETDPAGAAGNRIACGVIDTP